MFPELMYQWLVNELPLGSGMLLFHRKVDRRRMAKIAAECLPPRIVASPLIVKSEIRFERNSGLGLFE